jgi:glutathione synthase/RimK-type ligase-like ATP-grasp enzyme
LILIVTNERDLTSDYVVLELRRRNLRHVRLNTERLSQAQVDFRPQCGERSWKIILDGVTVDLSLIRAAYFRRPGIPIISAHVVGDAERNYCSSEWREIISAILSSIDSCWLNSPLAILSAENKPRQLAKACKLGFRIPETVITNSAEHLAGFLRKSAAVAKPLRSALLKNGVGESVIFTTRLSSMNIASEAGIKVAPFIIQREIAKKFDVRVTVVGESVFATEIHSQDRDETQTDWRRGSYVDLNHHKHDLPDEIAEKCISLTRDFDLKFGAIDLILDQGGQYWFLEINPNGQWAWIQNRTGQPIAEAIVDELVKISVS